MPINNSVALEKEYSFTMRNPGIRNFWWFFAGGPLLAIVFLILVLPGNRSVDTDWTLIVFFLLFFGGFISGMLYAYLHRKYKERVLIKENGLDSAFYGNIPFREIAEIGSSALFQEGNMILYLRNGKKIKWFPFVFGKENTSAEVGQFSSDLEKHLNAYAQHYAKRENTDSNDSPIKQVQPTRIQEGVSPLFQRKEKVEYAKSGAFFRKLAPYGTLILTTSIAARLLLGGIVRDYRNRDIKEAIRYISDPDLMRKSNETRDRIFKDSLIKYGPFFLFTNDTTAEIKFRKDRSRIYQDDLEAKSGSLDNKEASNPYQTYKDNGIPKGWDMGVQTHSSFFWLRSFAFDTSNVRAELFWKIGNEEDKIPISRVFQRPGGPDSATLNRVFEITIGKDQSIEAALKPYLTGWVRSLWAFYKTHPEHTKIYIVARHNAGEMDKKMFEEALQIIRENLQEMGIDTSKFFFKEFG